MPLLSLVLRDLQGRFRPVKEFGYEDFKRTGCHKQKCGNISSDFGT